MVYFICMWVLALGEDGFEKPYNIIPYYFFWGIVLRFGLDLKQGNSPIVPVMLYNAKLAQDVSRDMYAEGIYVVGFFFPVVPNGAARIRTQISAAHTKDHLDKGIEAFRKVGEKYGILGLGKKEIIEKYGK